MGFIQSTFFGLVLLCAFGSVILQETTSEPPITTSTIASTTTETPTSETTSKPTDPPTTLPPSTTTVPASTTPKPPLPEVGSWNISDGNVTCIRAELQIGFNIILGGVEESFVLSPNASDSGSECKAPNGTQVLALTYKNYALTFIFAKDSSNAFVQHIALDYITPQGAEIFYNSSQLFKAKVGNSFRCKTTDTILMGNATMQVYYIHIQAFGTAEDNGFNTAEECEADDKVSDIIPIAVGCALAALIIIVLIAYLVGRRRSRQKGYTSV
ncbi:lysosome-associated membrane glycoprotein 1-like [Argiope bruennichi]|uniref:lysosome-associated membrane glycoprotein 1-like n=1 Tax=Argiope bruennichi TaxID=94029 RepID=UPI0024953DC3|nr:lysosome-associated membrane glycoprotein 1-like [Argiope bruennichi]